MWPPNHKGSHGPFGNEHLSNNHKTNSFSILSVVPSKSQTAETVIKSDKNWLEVSSDSEDNWIKKENYENI